MEATAFPRMGWKPITGPTHTAAITNTEAPGSTEPDTEGHSLEADEPEAPEGEEGRPQAGQLLMF